MNATPVSSRPPAPAESPPPRDPKAAGAPQDPATSGDLAATGSAFAALIAEETEGPIPDEAAKTADPDGEAEAETQERAGPDPATPVPPVPVGPGLPHPLAQALAHALAPAQPAPPQGTDADAAALNPARAGQHAEIGHLGPDERRFKAGGEGDTASPKTPALPSPFEAMLAERGPAGDAQPSAAPPAGLAPPHALALPERPQTSPPATGGPPLPVVALPATIAFRALEGINRFDIRLDPEDLGRVDIALEFDGTGGIRAAIAADNADALQLIVREARALEQAFDQAGFRRDENALSFSLSDQQDSSRRQQGEARPAPRLTRFFVDGDTDTIAALSARAPAATGRLDVRI